MSCLLAMLLNPEYAVFAPANSALGYMRYWSVLLDFFPVFLNKARYSRRRGKTVCSMQLCVPCALVLYTINSWLAHLLTGDAYIFMCGGQLLLL